MAVLAGSAAIDMLVGNKVEPFDLTQVVFVGFWVVLQALRDIKKTLTEKSTN